MFSTRWLRGKTFETLRVSRGWSLNNGDASVTQFMNGPEADIFSHSLTRRINIHVVDYKKNVVPNLCGRNLLFAKCFRTAM